MAIVKRHKGDKATANKKGILTVRRANGNVVKINSVDNTIVRKKANGTVVRQKWTPMGETGVTKIKPTKMKNAVMSQGRKNPVPRGR